jgi:DHA2 family multidrug resistance protein-like MFS transporter
VTNDLIVSAVAPHRAGAAAAVSETGFELGGALGIAVLGSAATATYRGAVGPPNSLPLPASATDAARETLGGAVAAAQQLPTPLGDALLGIAREAFVDAVHVAALIGAALMLYNAVQALLLLRQIRTRPNDDATADTASNTVHGDHAVGGAVDGG